MAEKLDSAAQKVTPRDAQKGGQGALSKDHPEIQLKEDAPLSGDTPAQGEQASVLSNAQIELLAEIGERDLSDLRDDKRQCLEQLLAGGYIARLESPSRFKLTVKGTNFLSERGAGLNEA